VWLSFISFLFEFISNKKTINTDKNTINTNKILDKAGNPGDDSVRDFLSAEDTYCYPRSILGYDGRGFVFRKMENIDPDDPYKNMQHDLENIMMDETLSDNEKQQKIRDYPDPYKKLKNVIMTDKTLSDNEKIKKIKKLYSEKVCAHYDFDNILHFERVTKN